MSAPVVYLIVGPVQHGVVALAGEIAHSLPRRGRCDIVRVADVRELYEAIELGAVGDGFMTDRTVHLHFTDRLFGTNCEEAAGAFRAAATRLGQLGNRVAVTLHDIPIAVDDTNDGRYRRRSRAYAAVVSAATGPVIVCSHHEAQLLARCAPSADPVVIELPIDAAPQHPSRSEIRPEVAILGFIHPGKGHAQALKAMTQLPSHVEFSALGRPADNHHDLVEELGDIARSHGRALRITGWIAEHELRERLRQVSIPLAAHHELSASASIGSWLSAGRRPLVPDVGFTRELEARCPGTVTRYPAGGLEAALMRAFANPESTWLAGDVVLQPSRRQVAERYLETLSPC